MFFYFPINRILNLSQNHSPFCCFLHKLKPFIIFCFQSCKPSSSSISLPSRWCPEEEVCKVLPPELWTLCPLSALQATKRNRHFLCPNYGINFIRLQWQERQKFCSELSFTDTWRLSVFCLVGPGSCFPSWSISDFWTLKCSPIWFFFKEMTPPSTAEEGSSYLKQHKETIGKDKTWKSFSVFPVDSFIPNHITFLQVGPPH